MELYSFVDMIILRRHYYSLSPSVEIGWQEGLHDASQVRRRSTAGSCSLMLSGKNFSGSGEQSLFIAIERSNALWLRGRNSKESFENDVIGNTKARMNPLLAEPHYRWQIA